MQTVAHEVVALSQCLSIEDTIGQELRVNTDEAVGCASVATDAAKFEVLEQHSIGVGTEEEDVIGVESIASVPVVRDALVSRSVLEVSVVTSDGVKRLEDVAVQLALRVFGRLVGHETVNEAPRCRLSDDTGERGVEEVASLKVSTMSVMVNGKVLRVLFNVFLEACGSSVGQKLEVVVVVRLSSIVECFPPPTLPTFYSVCLCDRSKLAKASTKPRIRQ